MNELRLIVSNPFDIPQRLMELDQYYRVYYNAKRKNFELHNLQQQPTFQLVLPFEQLDSRVVDYVRRTRVDKILAEIEGIDEYNLQIEQKAINQTLDEFHTKTKSVINYMNRGGSQIPSYSEL